MFRSIWDKIKSTYARVRDWVTSKYQEVRYNQTVSTMVGMRPTDLLKKQVTRAQLQRFAEFYEGNARFHEANTPLDPTLMTREQYEALAPELRSAYTRRYTLAKAQLYRELAMVAPEEGFPLSSVGAYLNARLRLAWEAVPEAPRPRDVPVTPPKPVTITEVTRPRRAKKAKRAA